MPIVRPGRRSGSRADRQD